VLLYPQVLEEGIIEKAQVINYKNSNINLMLLKIDTSFDPSEFLEKLRSTWKTDVAKPII